MKRREPGLGGAAVPVIGQGTWHLEHAAPGEAIRALRCGLDRGMSPIDTAEMCGSGRVEGLAGTHPRGPSLRRLPVSGGGRDAPWKVLRPRLIMAKIYDGITAGVAEAAEQGPGPHDTEESMLKNENRKKEVRSVAVRAFLVSLGIGGLLWTATAAWAQSGSIRGRVVDENGDPLADVEVVIEFLGGVTRTRNAGTNDRGEFIVAGLPTGSYRVTYKKEGYQPIFQEVRVPAREVLRIDDAVLPALEGGEDPELVKIFGEGVEAAKRGDFQEALTAFERYTEQVPDSAEAHFNAGFAAEQLKDLDRAIQHYEKAAELRPGYYEAHLALGDIYGVKRDWSKAAENLEKVLELRPEEILPLYNYGVVQMNLQNMAAAQEAFQKVVTLDPARADAYFQLGLVLVNQGKTEDAIPHFEKYLELEPEGDHAATAQGLVDQLKSN